MTCPHLAVFIILFTYALDGKMDHSMAEKVTKQSAATPIICKKKVFFQLKKVNIYHILQK